MGIYKRYDNEWYIDYYAQGRRMREKIGHSRKLAEIILKKRKVEIAENKFLDIKRDKKIKFPQLAEEFLKNYSKPNNRSYKNDIHFVKKLVDFFGDVYIFEISSLAIEKYKTERLTQVKQASVNRELDVLKSMFSRAVEWGMLRENPARPVKKFKVDNRRTRFLTLDEIKRLTDACSGYMRDIIIVAVNTGMRRGELLGLKWENVDFDNKLIFIPGSLSKNKYNRQIPMNDLVIGILTEIKKNGIKEYVFCGTAGKQFGDVKKGFHSALEKAGITDFRFHDLRHTFCSQLVKAGVDIYTVMELAGHKSIGMTMRYSHLSPDQKKQAVDALGSNMVTIWSLEQKDGFGKNKKAALLSTTK